MPNPINLLASIINGFVDLLANHLFFMVIIITGFVLEVKYFIKNHEFFFPKILGKVWQIMTKEETIEDLEEQLKTQEQIENVEKQLGELNSKSSKGDLQ